MLHIDRMRHSVVLVVDDVPENLALLYDALEEAGHAVLVATNGEAGLARARQCRPDIVLLDAMMPGMDGFEVARRLKADADTEPIPIVFMTGLTETEHVLNAFATGSVDYVTKPIRPAEVVARVHTHIRNAMRLRRAGSLLDAHGQACLAVQPDSGRILWQTPLARRLLQSYCGGAQMHLPEAVLVWLQRLRAQPEALRDTPPLKLAGAEGRLLCHLHGCSPDEGCLLLLREENDAALIRALAHSLALTAREAEVLYWVMRGKTNRDIGDILGVSHRTVNKHMEHLFAKLGVETRTAAAALAMQRLRLSPETVG
ncbi:MAG: response regulator transcription factor [Burkholderiales bacterium]|nr:response regulator transcription factor [Burkholderiales bacterium]